MISISRFSIFLLVMISWAAADDYSELEDYDPTELRSRIVMVNGNMCFYGGYSKNISFKTSGAGRIWIGDTDISELPTIAKVSQLKEAQAKMKDDLTRQNAKLTTNERTIAVLFSISRNLVAVVRNISSDVSALSAWKKDKIDKDVKIRKFIRNVTKGIRTITDILNMRPCASNPCQHGGTCIGTFGKHFQCICPPHRTGTTCENDLDECSLYENACQNNGTCVNTENGYSCNCSRGYHGPLCQFQVSTCRQGINLCGRGHCLEKFENEKAGYTCICDSGYKISDDLDNPTCVDDNECLQNPCHPGVECINLPGTFQCTGCPKGYQGNGKTCVDVDECSIGSYPCSSAPRVPCFNTIGSYHCGSCPAGYRGDGKSCHKVSACTTRPCHPQAECTDDVDNLNAGGFVCNCPAGYMGDGIGSEGCVQSNSTVCKPEGRCMNGGTCRPVSDNSYRCACPDNYLGAKCEKVSECISAPCKNNGTCSYDPTDGYSCSCLDGFYGHDCERQEDACGLHLYTKEGNLTFPDDLKGTSTAFCDIVIQPTSNNEALRLTFTSFDEMGGSSGPTDCTTTKGNLTLYDGDNDNSPVFTIFCGERSSPKAPLIGHVITMTGSRALLRFRGTEGKFQLQWDLAKRGCGYRTSEPAGTLTIPPHHMNASCGWFISAPMEQRIEVTIPPFSMPSKNELNCSVNELEVFDGYTSYDAHRVTHICESNNESITVTSTGPFLSVEFVNNVLFGAESDVQPGFAIKYKFVEPETKCGGEIINTGDDQFEGEITSPNFGGFYPPDMDCVWKIDGSANFTEDHNLKLEFETFDVVSPYLFVGNTPTAAFLKRFSNLPDHVTERIFGKGLTLVGRRRLVFAPMREAAKCSEDYVHVYVDGNLEYDVCNGHTATSIALDKPQAIVKFHSNDRKQGKGFKLKYSLACEKHLSGNGTVKSWNYPEGGRKGKCTYIIKAQNTQAIRIKWKTIGLRSATSQQCYFGRGIPEDNEDYIQISGGSEEFKQLNTRYICAKYPFVENGEFVLSGSRPLKIEYSSSGSPNNKGILFEYNVDEVGCGGIFSQTSGVISSPNYPDKYLPHMYCIYTINVPWSKQARLTFENFDIEVIQNDECTFDRVEVYDRYYSPTDKGELLGKFCGSMLPPSILSPSFRMAVVFISDRSISGNGFSAKFESVDATQDCHRTFTAPSGVISFDGSLGKYASCDYHISVPHNMRIVLSPLNISIPCEKAKLMIKNGVNDQSPGFPSLWGESEVCNSHTLQSTIRSQGNRLYMKLYGSDLSDVKFNISYEQITSQCGGIVHGVSGSISAPQYPMKDSRPRDCSWIIGASPGNRIRFQVTMIDDLKSSDDQGFCGIFASNRLDVLEGPEADGRMMRRYCKKVIGSTPLLSTSNEIQVKYKQHGGVQFGSLFGFLAQYTTVCTDIVLTDSTGSIQSPGYPSPVYTNQFCSWTIKVPQGNRIEVTFHTLVVDAYRNFRGLYRPRGLDDCPDAYFKTNKDEVAEAVTNNRGSLNVTSTIPEKYCSIYGNLVKIKSTSNVLNIGYMTKSSHEENKFWLSWRTIGCGGNIVSPTEINAVKPSWNTSMHECHWKITAPIGMKISMNIEYLSIVDACSKSVEKSDNGLEVYAGTSNISGYPGDFICAPVQKQVIKSHSNEMFVKLKLPTRYLTAANEQKYFQAKIEFEPTTDSDKDDCGAVIQVPSDSSKTIHSPRFPEEYPRGTECQWLFQAPPGFHLMMKLKEYLTPNAHEQRQNRNFLPKYIMENNTWVMTQSMSRRCYPPFNTIEGSLSIYGGPDRTQAPLKMFCWDIKAPYNVSVAGNQSLVTFTGASTPRVHMNAEDDHTKRVGFVLEVSAACGGELFATEEEQQLILRDTEPGICNITIRKKDPDQDGIILRIDAIDAEHTMSSWIHSDSTEGFFTTAFEITADDGETISRAVTPAYHMSSQFQYEEFRAENEFKIGIRKGKSYMVETIIFSFSTDIESCGADLTAQYGNVRPFFNRDFSKPFECVYTVKNTPGNKVTFTLPIGYRLPESPDCVDSFIEVRKFNESGEILKRVCGTSQLYEEFIAESIWVKVRYTPPKDEIDEEEEQVEAALEGQSVEPHAIFKYYLSSGGTVGPGVIESPKKDKHHQYVVWNLKAAEGKGILIHFEKVSFPEIHSGLRKYGLYIAEGDPMSDSLTRFHGFEEALNNAVLAVTGFQTPSDLYINQSAATIIMTSIFDQVYFRLNWEEVELRPNTTDEDAGKTDYSCGGNLIPTFDWQDIKNPTEPGQATGYPPNTHCKWSIERPLLSGLQIRIVSINLEPSANCDFDFLAFVPDKALDDGGSTGDNLDNSQKVCQLLNNQTIYNYGYNRILYIHFVSDASRNGLGFHIQYKLSCNSFDFIKPSHGIFDHVLTSPGYPTKKEDASAIYGGICSWSLILNSNRRIAVDILDLDMKDTQQCLGDFLVVDRRMMATMDNRRSQRMCGKLEDLQNKTIMVPHGRLFVRYMDKGTDNRGFKLRIREIVEECSSGLLHVDDETPNGTLTTPQYPALIPNSVDCEYVISAPSGRRVQLTVDPKQFRMEGSDNCMCESCDFIEIRDGPTEHSTLIGRYCGSTAPSTITATSNYLFLRIRTDSIAKSNGFKATYNLATCGGTVVLRQNQTFNLRSPQYPDIYPAEVQCEWTVHSPNTHMIDMRLNHLFLNWNVNCTNDYLLVKDGNSTADDLFGPICNSRIPFRQPYRTASNLATVKFQANSTIQRSGRQFCLDKKCGFELQLNISEVGCGGDVTDNAGSLYTPGYPNRLLPHVQCSWNFNAGPGYRYLLEFEFTSEKTNFDQIRFNEDQAVNCFPNLRMFNGPSEYERSHFDLYSRVFCTSQTTFLSDADVLTLLYSDHYTRSLAAFSGATDEGTGYAPFRVNYTKVPTIVDDNGCTRLIDSNMTTIITANKRPLSPSSTLGSLRLGGQVARQVVEKYRTMYFTPCTNKNMFCTEWPLRLSRVERYCHFVLKRPNSSGTMVVGIKNYTDIYGMKHERCSDWDSFIAIKDEDENPRVVDERICNSSFIRGKDMILPFVNDDIEMHVMITRAIENVTMSFTLDVQYQPCGGVIDTPNSGIITSPNFGEGRPYLANSNCLWLLKAPEGQVVSVTITDLDVEFDPTCKKDRLVIGEGRDNTIIHKYCTREQQEGESTSDQLTLADRLKSMKSHSQYLWLNWVTDSEQQYRGFRVEYEFVDVAGGCGFTTHALSGVVHSPNFPKNYPADQECIWDIQVPIGFHIKLTYSHFNIQPSEGCAQDSLTISEEHSARANDPMGEYFFLFQDEQKTDPKCGVIVPKPYESTANRIRLNFTTNSEIEYDGFRAEWSAECGAVFRLDHYSIVSPYYPVGYPNNNSVCNYLIDPKGSDNSSVVLLKMMDFDLNGNPVEFGRYPCASDYVEILDVLNNRVVETYCGGTEINQEPIAIKGAVGIRFVTNATYFGKEKKLHRGFQISYSIKKCGGDIYLAGDEDSKFVTTISTPAFPLDYAHNLLCEWNITTTGDRVLDIKFVYMEIEMTNDCTMDALEMYDGTEYSNKTQIGALCGSLKMLPRNVFSTKTSNLLMKFTSDHSMSKGGFKAVITATLGPEHGCGGNLKATADWQTLTPPMKSDGKYQNNLHCGWNIIGPEKTMIEMKLEKMETERLQPLPGDQPDNICVDKLMLYDGYKAFSPLLAEEICSEKKPKLPAFYHSSHRVVHAYFESDLSGAESGFEMKYRAIKPDCGDWFTATSEQQEIAYETKDITDALGGQTVQRCQWIIQSKSQTPIWIHIKNLFFLSNDRDCSDGFIEIRDVGILSKCEHPACAKREVEKKVIKVCGSSSIAPFISNTMAVQITTSAIMRIGTTDSFTMAYQLLDNCNRTIDASELPSGRLTSPHFPNPYGDSHSCQTVINAPKGKVILVVFKSFQLERGTLTRLTSSDVMRLRSAERALRYGLTLRNSVYTCDHDAVQLREDGVNATREYCGLLLPPTYLTNGTNLSISLRSDDSVTAPGYDLSYFTGKFYPSSNSHDFGRTYDHTGAITNIGYPAFYNKSVTQRWLILPPAGHACQVEIQVLSLALHIMDGKEEDCGTTDEYLEITVPSSEGNEDEGLKASITQRLRTCSHTAPLSFSVEASVDRTIDVLFKSDNKMENDGQGFKLVWDCDVTA